MEFEWDEEKNTLNQEKHGVSFSVAQHAFADLKRVISFDMAHSSSFEKRHFCFGMINGRVLTVRFTNRNGKIRIYGAGFWREGKARYEKENRLR